MPEIVAYGNPFDGITLVGPFEDAEAAGWWAEENLRHEEWWTVSLTPPVEDESRGHH